MEEKKLLEIGDVLYSYGRWDGLNKHIIKSVSPKRAKSEYGEFYRELTKDYSNKETAKGYGTYSNGYLETEKLKSEYNLQNLNRKAERFIRDFKRAGKLTADEAKEVISLFTKLNIVTEKQND